MDPIHTLTKWLDRNRNLAAGLALSVGATAYLFACESKTASLLSVPGQPPALVSRSQFQAEAAKVESALIADRASIDATIAAFNARVEATNASIEAGATDLNRQDEIRAQVVNTVTGLIPNLIAGAFNPAQLLGTATGLLGLFAGGGAVLDNRRKDRLLALKKAPPTGTPPAA